MGLKLNLASGHDIRDGWVNLDVVPKWPLANRGCDIVWDARKDRIPFDNDSVEEVYAGYLLLHLAPKYHNFVLSEINRVLHPDGIFTIHEVDMDILFRKWLEDPANSIYCRLIWGEQGARYDRIPNGAVKQYEDLADFDKHCHGFTEQTLRSRLVKSRFSVIDRVKIFPDSSNIWYELTLKCKKAKIRKKQFSKPLVSIIMPTMRVGGLDVVFSGLQNQTFKDFEFIISDALYQYRKDVVEWEAHKYDFRVKHLEPIGNSFPLNCFCRHSNTALIHAEGKIVLFITDYTWLPPHCVERHVELSGEHCGILGPHEYVRVPQLHPSFPKYVKPKEDPDTEVRNEVELKKYLFDLDNGRLDEVMWSLFDTPFEHPTGLSDDDMKGADPKLRMPAGPITPNYFCGKNDSCYLDRVLEANGWDEALDGSHAYQDTDLGCRLTMKYNVSWIMEPSIRAFIVNPRNIFPRGRRTRHIDTNQQMWVTRHNAGYPGKINSWNLTEKRKEILNGRR